MTISNQALILDFSVANVIQKLDLQNLAGSRLFITGGTGFFGLWLLTAIRVMNSQGFEIKACVLSRNPSAFLSHHSQFSNQSWLQFITGNVRNFQFPKCQFDFLLHAATDTSMDAHANSSYLFDDIIFGTRRVLELAEFCSVKRALLISSGAVYGAQPPHLTHQPDDSLAACNPWLPSSAYGEGKRVMELMGAIFQQSVGIECLSARCFSFCGPGLPLDGHYAFSNFIRDAIYNDRIIIKSDGSSKRSYLYGADLAVWLLFLLIKGQSGTSYNVGSDKAITVKELAFLVRDTLVPNMPVEILKNTSTDSVGGNNYVPDISRARNLGCIPWTSLTDSIIMNSNYIIKK